MYREKIDKLQELNALFDIFMKSPPVPPPLLLKGLFPPLPVLNNYLVWGFPYLRQAAELGINELSCVTLDGGMAAALETALLMENRTDRYSWAEKGNLLSLLRTFPHIPRGERLLSLVQSSGSFIPLSESFLALPEYIQTAVDTELIDLKTGEKISAIPESSFNTLKECLSVMSFSNRKQFLSMFTEILLREEMTSTEADSFAADLLKNDEPLRLLYKKRYPRLSEMESVLEQFREDHLRGSGVELLPPPNFEGNSYTLRFSWKSERQLAEVIDRLVKLKQTGNELFKLLY